MVLRAEGRVFIRAHLRHLRIPLSGFAASREIPLGAGGLRVLVASMQPSL
jgi:hypothetical protein